MQTEHLTSNIRWRLTAAWHVVNCDQGCVCDTAGETLDDLQIHKNPPPTPPVLDCLFQAKPTPSRWRCDRTMPRKKSLLPRSVPGCGNWLMAVRSHGVPTTEDRCWWASAPWGLRHQGCSTWDHQGSMSRHHVGRCWSSCSGGGPVYIPH